METQLESDFQPPSYALTRDSGRIADLSSNGDVSDADLVPAEFIPADRSKFTVADSEDSFDSCSSESAISIFTVHSTDSVITLSSDVSSGIMAGQENEDY